MIGRVADTIAGWGREGGYFATDEEADTFEDELNHILLNQMAAFNSPVWFNVGFEEKPQCSACFILSRRRHDGVDPRLDHQGGHDLPRRLRLGHQPLEHPRLEGAALQGRPRLRPGLVHARRRRLGRHDQVGRQDAPRGQDGRARRRPPGHRGVHLVQGARGGEGARARDAGFDMSLDGEGFTSIQYQNANNSVRVTDEFMERVEQRRGLAARRRASTGEPVETFDARDLLRPDRRGRLALRRSGRPVRHDDQRLAHLPELGPDQRVEPVLASTCTSTTRPATSRRSTCIKFRREDGSFDVDAFEHAVDVMFLAQEIIVGSSSYPTEKIGENARAFRQLGLGYANLGALLMASGLPYDSDEGRAVAGAITALMTGRAYRTVGRDRRRRMGPTTRYEENRDAAQPRDAQAPRRGVRASTPAAVADRPARGRAARVGRGDRARRGARLPQRAGHGARADRHDLLHDGLRHHRHRARLLARQVQEAGRRRRDDDRQPDGAAGAARSSATPTHEVDQIVALHRRARHDRRRARRSRTSTCRCSTGGRRARDLAHGPRQDDGRGPAVHLGRDLEDRQPARAESTVEDIADAYIEGWKLGLKALAIYRDGSKTAQPLRTDAQDEEGRGAGRRGRGGQAHAPPDAARAPVDHAQVLGRRARGLHHGGMFEDGTRRRDLPQTSPRRARRCAA